MKEFINDFEFGKMGEDLFIKSNSWKLMFPNTEIEKINNLEQQKIKGDFKCGDNFIEIKTRKPLYNWYCGRDIVIELFNELEGKNLFEGWLSKYEENTYLFYQWTTMEDQQLKLMRPIIVFKPYELRNHLNWLNRYKIKSSENKNYNTKFITIPLEKLKEKIKIWIITEDRII